MHDILRRLDTRFPRLAVAGIVSTILLTGFFLAGASNRKSTSKEAASKSDAREASGVGANWIEVDYASLVDRRRLSHSGESIGMLLEKLGGRPASVAGDRAEDLRVHKLLDPLLEPFAFVLPDSLDSLSGATGPPLVELGWLYQPGEAQPAWAELLRSRRFILESDGAGHLRACLPWSQANPPGTATGVSTNPEIDSATAAREAWESAWPVLRHVLAAERRRLARRAANDPEKQPLDVEVHAYVSYPARLTFQLGVRPYRARIDDTRPRGDRPPPDLKALRALLERGFQVEGGRLDADGRLHWFFSEVPESSGLLGRPLALSDFAVAQRAVFHGGLSEPYMSLDRGNSPQVSAVNYGGRLQDTSLGLVSLLCDIRFKTFSVGVDILGRGDLREEVRRLVPSFRTHMERFAADPTSQDVSSQQTRFWFYPDDVDLTLSSAGDVLAMRRVRMTAASERIEQAAGGQRMQDRPWTAETIVGINQHYDELVRPFPELADLDQTVRLLCLFTWLRHARDDGLAIPDLDDFLAIELPPLPTPRRFPQLLTDNVVPPPGVAGPLDVFDKVPIGEALERLLPRGGRQLSPRRRFARAMATLDRRASEQAALAKEMEAQDLKTLDESAIDRMAYRAERLKMHELVLGSLAPKDRESVARRRSGGEAVRVFSVGIGGIDLGMGQALARASRRGQRLGSGTGASPSPSTLPAAGSRSVPSASAGAGGTEDQPKETKEEWRSDPKEVPAIVLPDHGLDAETSAKPTPFGEGKGTVAGREFGNHWIQQGTWKGGAKQEIAWTQTVLGADSPDVRTRRVIRDPSERLPTIERVEDGRFVRFRLESDGGRLRATPGGVSLPPEALEVARPSDLGREPSIPASPAIPVGLAVLDILGPSSPTEATAGEAATPGEGGEPAGLRLRLRAARKDVEASFPRGTLQRLVLGQDADPARGRPLAGLTPPEQLLDGARVLMIEIDPAKGSPPWAGPTEPVPGEEDASVVASALQRWWTAQAPAGHFESVVVGTEPDRSMSRWAQAPKPGKKSVLLLPEDAFPSVSDVARRTELSRAWPASDVLPTLTAGTSSQVVILVSAEAPGVLAARLRTLVRSGALQGKLLAVYALQGRVRPDLPESLLKDGKLAGFGLAEASPVGQRAAVDEIVAFGRSLEGADPSRRIEEIPGPFLWYF